MPLNFSFSNPVTSTPGCNLNLQPPNFSFGSVRGVVVFWEDIRDRPTFFPYTFSVLDTSDIDLTFAANVLSADLTVTGVTAATYGSATVIPTFTVDSKGRISFASESANLSSAFWALNGNTVGAEKWIGTVDNFAFPFRTNNIEAGRVNTSQNWVFGIAGITAAARVHIRGVDATRDAYALYVENSTPIPLVTVDNFGNTGIGTANANTYAESATGRYLAFQHTTSATVNLIAPSGSNIVVSLGSSTIKAFQFSTDPAVGTLTLQANPTQVGTTMSTVSTTTRYGVQTHTATYTALANNEYGWKYNGTLTATATASDILNGLLINPTLVAGANNQVLSSLKISPTFTNGAFTGLTNLGIHTETVNNRIQYDAIATTITYGLELTNRTDADAAITRQYSPSLYFRGSTWETGTASRTTEWRVTAKNSPGSSTQYESILSFETSLGGAAFTGDAFFYRKSSFAATVIALNINRIESSTQVMTFAPNQSISLVGNLNTSGTIFAITNASRTVATSNTYYGISVTETFALTSNTGTYAGIAILNTINQTGTATGISRALYIAPVLTAAVDFRAIETTIGNIMFLTGSTTLYSVGVGVALSSSLAARLHVVGAGADSTTSALIVQNSTPSTMLTVGNSGRVLFTTYHTGTANNDYGLALLGTLTGSSTASRTISRFLVNSPITAGNNNQRQFLANFSSDFANGGFSSIENHVVNITQVGNVLNTWLRLEATNSSTSAAVVRFAKSRSGGIATAGDGMGSINFFINDGQAFPSDGTMGASISTLSEAITGAGNVRGSIYLATTNDSSAVNRFLRMWGNGDVILGSTSVSTATGGRFHVIGSGTGTTFTALFQNSSATTSLGVVDNGNVGIGISAAANIHSTLTVNGSFARAYVAKTATYTITASDSIIECTSGTFTVTLPTAVGISGRIYTVDNSGAGVITLDGDGTETINGALTQAITTNTSLTVYSNGANWRIIN